MATSDRLRRQQILREAEGYLDLVLVLSDQWELPVDVRDRIVARSLAALDRLQDAGGDASVVLFLRGQALRAMERYAEAIRPLEQAARIDEENVHIYLALGWCYKRVNQLDKAIEALESAESVNDTEAIVFYNLACYWSLARNVKNAVAYLSRALAMDPHYRELIDREHDFDAIRREPEFQALTSVIV